MSTPLWCHRGYHTSPRWVTTSSGKRLRCSAGVPDLSEGTTKHLIYPTNQSRMFLQKAANRGINTLVCEAQYWVSEQEFVQGSSSAVRNENIQSLCKKGYVVTAKLAVLPLWSRRWSLIQQTCAPAQRKPSPSEMGYQGRQKRCAHWPGKKRRWTPLCYSLNQKISLSHLRISLTVDASEVVPPENSKTSD